MCGAYGLQPNSLPDAAVGRVPDAAWRDALLAVGLSAISRVPYSHLQFLRATLFQKRCDVECEGNRTAVVSASQLAVHIDVATPVNCSEVQQDVLAAESIGQGKGAAIHVCGPSVRGVTFVHDARESRLDGERHENGFREGRDVSLVVIVDRSALEVLPNAIQVHPFLSLH